MKLRHYIRYPFDRVRAQHRLSERTTKQATFTNVPVVLDLYTTDLLIDCGRHFATIADDAAKNGSQVIIRSSGMLLAAIAHKPFGSQMLAMDNVNWIPPHANLPSDAFVMVDVASSRANRSRTSLSSTEPLPVTEMLIGKTITNDYPVMPYPMHPGVLKCVDRNRIKLARANPNRKGIFFAGSQRAKYGRDVIGKGFGVLNRLEILAFMRDTFVDRIVTREHENQSKPQSHARSPMPIILPPTQKRDRAVPIPIDQWLATLAKHQFFLCCPGIAQPMCHNIVEAVSVGVIPIIEYAQRLTPALEDGVNAIVFEGRDGLRKAINRIDQMTPASIARMSENVADYYDTHLDRQTFLSQQLSMPRRSNLKICLPFHDEDLTAMKSHLTTCVHQHHGCATTRAA